MARTDPIERFQAYADAFEDFYEGGDAKVLEPFFSEDAVYEILADPPFADVHEGRDAIFAGLAESVGSFDKRFDSRELELLEGPEVRGTDGDAPKVWMRWKVTYRVGDAPPVEMEGEETATFDGDRIVRLEDRFSPEGTKAALAWMQEHASKLKS